MANPITLDFEGGGSLADDIRALARETRELAVVHRKAQEGIQADLSKTSAGAKAMEEDFSAAADTVVALGKETTKTAKATADSVALSRKQAAQIIADNRNLTESQKRQAAAAGGITKEYEAIAGAATVAKAAQVQAFEEPLGLLDQIQSRIDLLQQRKLALVDEEAIARTNDELDTLQAQFDGIYNSTTRTVTGTKELRARLKEAQDQALRAKIDFGELSPEFNAAAQEVANIKKELKDVQERVQALDPGDKVAAFSQLGNAIASGAQAVSGAAIALGGNNAELQESLFKFQSLLFALQGAQQFLRDIGSALDSVRAVLGLTTTAQTVNTAATEAGTVATVANTAATTATATASTAAAGATGILTGAIRTLTTAIASNPIGAIAVALAAIVGVLLLLGDTAEDATKRIDGLLDRLRFLEQSQRRTAENMRFLADIQNELDLLGTDDTPQRQREQALRAQRRQLDLIDEDLNNAKSKQEELLQALESLDPDAENFESNRDRITQALDEVVAVIDEAGSRRLQVEGQTQLELAKIQDQANKDAIEKAKQLSEERLRIQEELAGKLEGLEKELQSSLARLQSDQADPLTRVELQRQAIQEETDLLERNLLRVAALEQLRVQIGTEAYSKLTDRQKQARADSLIDAGTVQLTLTQQEQLNRLRLAQEQAYLDELTAAYNEQASARIDLIADAAEQERQRFEQDLQGRMERLRKAGLDELAIREYYKREVARFNQTAALEAIDLEEQIRTAEINARVSNGEVEKRFERQKQEELLAVRIEAARKKLELLDDNGTQERQLERAQLQALIADLQREAQTLRDTPLDINLLDLLGVAAQDQQRVKEALGQIFQATQQIISANIAARQQEVQAAINATDQIIGDAQRRRSELQGELDRALEDQRNGYANNADAIRDQIEQTKQAERDALEEKKRQILEQRRLAKEQILVDAAAQASAIVTSVANLIKTWSTLPFGVGLLSAFAQAATIYAFMSSTRARIRQANNSGPTFRMGGRLKRSTLEGPSHELGGIALLDRRTGHYYGEAEGGEGIVSRRAMEERGGMVDAINVGDIARLQRHARRELERAGYMVLQREDVNRMRGAFSGLSAHAPSDSLLGMILGELAAVREELAGFRRQEASRERVDGNVTRRPQHTTIRR